MDTRVLVSMWLLAPCVSRWTMGMMSGANTAPAAMVTSVNQTSELPGETSVIKVGAITMVTAAAACWDQLML